MASPMLPTIADLGGEDKIYTLTTDGDIDLYTASVALCSSWPDVRDRTEAAAWLTRTIGELSPEELDAFDDIILTNEDALPDLATDLQRCWRSILTGNHTLLGNIALEAWTRLALGGWTDNTLTLRSALWDRAWQAAHGEADADVYLVRSLSAALDLWAEDDLVQALESLADLEDLESDVAFELGMADVRAAVQADAIDDAVRTLRRAERRFDQAGVEGPRPDAVAFGTACGAVADFLGGGVVTETAVARIEHAAREWLRGYLGEDRHWRQPRAQTAAAWAALVNDLHRAETLDEPAWFEPPAMLATIGRLYSAHNSSMLLSRTGRPPDDATAAPISSGTGPVPLAIGARLDAALVERADRLYLLDRWLERTSADPGDSQDTAAILAMRAARERLRDTAGPPGKAEASPTDAGGAAAIGPPAETDLHAAWLEPGVLADLAALRPGAVQATPIAEDLVLRARLTDFHRIRATDTNTWAWYLASIITACIRFVRLANNHAQGGERRFLWHGPQRSDRAPEHTLADQMRLAVEFATGFPTHVEVPNMGGGRADILISVGAEQFVIEVKTVTEIQTDDELVRNYGDQAGQYTLSGPPFAFLAILDQIHRTSRLPLSHSFWVRPWTVPDTADVRPLLGMRVLASVDPPSALSR